MLNQKLHLFLLKHGRMRVSIQDIDGQNSGGGLGGFSLILGFNNHLILLYFLEHILC